LLLELKEERTTKYKISERGSVFLEKYSQLQDFVQAYGLRL
jgi:predicted transcriptional regulator